MVARPFAAKNRDILPACSFRRYHMDTIRTKAGVMEASKLVISASEEQSQAVSLTIQVGTDKLRDLRNWSRRREG